jgi:Putative peptidoglycan binding domain
MQAAVKRRLDAEWSLRSQQVRASSPSGVARAVVLTAALAFLCGSFAVSAYATAGSPFAANALWLTSVPSQATPQSLSVEAAQAGTHTLFVKAGEGVTAEPQFSPPLVAALRGAGMSVCAWTFVRGLQPLAEATVAIAAVHSGAQCLVVDAEGEYDKLYGAAQLFVRTLRHALGARFPIALAGQAEVLQHPTFPYSVFLGPGAFDYDMPQIYWRDLGVSVDGAFAASIGVNSIYGRPLAPVGQLFGEPPPAEIARFRALATAYGAPGWSFFDLDAASPSGLAALAEDPIRLPRRAPAPPTVRAGADGDEIVWAQELLDAAGAHLPVGGFFGAQTARALEHFQSHHRLHADGVLGAATWRALERLHPHEPSWAKGPPDSAR